MSILLNQLCELFHDTITIMNSNDNQSASKAADAAETGSISTMSSAASYVKSGQENKSSTRNGTKFSVQDIKDKALKSQIKFA
ncbi:unnamed protein product [Clonostachys byssicola]|uniref:Uncharacterized protein n=1 Tax=Clonostachys byssicola TaxID=160290 RepID=A0A9N9UV05_9HYPO|nr:unnamed protein product [Clonostachys byssicola]